MGKESAILKRKSSSSQVPYLAKKSLHSATKVNRNFQKQKLNKSVKHHHIELRHHARFMNNAAGCQLQHLSYNQQLVEKRDIVVQAMERYTKNAVSSLNIKETIGMEDPGTTGTKADSKSA